MSIKKIFLAVAVLLGVFTLPMNAQQQVKLKKKDRKRDVEFVTTVGTIIIRLSDSTPLHRDNFLKLVKSGFYDSVLFHRVISGFMIQAGDPNSKKPAPAQRLGGGSLGYTIPAEFKTSLFHRRGALAAARIGDQENPMKASSASQFYIVQGKVFSDPQMDSIEKVRLQGYRLPESHRQVYRTVGGTPQLDQNYTVFGEVMKGLEAVDLIASVETYRDRPVNDVRILSARLIKRKKIKR